MGLNNDVSVFKVDWQPRWRVSCVHCDCWVWGANDWQAAYAEAVLHASEHEGRRCEHCGRTS